MAGSSPRLSALDALRGIAALAVVLFHYVPYYHQLYGHTFTPWSTLDFGRYGVHLFFILSGFVIFMTLERTRTAGWFGLARAFRLLPALWAGIVLTFLAVHLMGPADRAVSLGSALMNTTLLHEYLEFPHVDGAYWSLVIEATFYCWIALLFYGLQTWRRLRVALWVWVLVSYAGVIWWKAIPDGIDFLVKDLLFVKYAPLFVSGMLIYRWHHHGRPASGDLLLLALAVGHALQAYNAPFNLFVLGCYAVFVLAVAGYLNALANRPLLWLGSLSYALYLVHQNIGYGVIGWSYQVGFPGWAGVMLALTVALTLACLIHYGIEKPALAWFRGLRQRTRARPDPLPVRTLP
ncbi:MAG: acyltransferase family protein [Pseudomonadota bacterium]